MSWLTLADIKFPQQGNYPTEADWKLAIDSFGALMSPGLYFLSGQMGPQYASPQKFIENLQAEAFGMTQNPFGTRAPAGWNFIQAGMKAALDVFAILSQLPVNAGDPNTVSIMEAWQSGKGLLYGGHDPIPVDRTPVGTPTPAGGPVTILGQPVG